MTRHIKKCLKCDNYSMQDKCKCGSNTILPRPPKFSINDKYTKYKRDSKKENLKKSDLY
jgi:H/ACA ribonucleoprotein complex subunit 3